ncbi:unnamed protein product [Adineta ricciae]|uniref:G-protein coupled receptors family 1 profile domain-containing protein n=1 Tax=Adineta ricciae TaxID=249248 RepID=A0A815C7N6_ADIRI|nr:unnamed protein product [Adineta ricciae]CAF1276795.1 unnamed protein product [Adineta ricciae]
MLNQAFSDDSGSWWWWINVIGTLVFGLTGLIGNFICFFVVCRFPLSQHSFVEYLRALSFFDFFTLFYEVLHSSNDLSVYLFSTTLLNFRSSIVCKFHDYIKHSIILLSCWTIVILTFDRYILVCTPYSKKWPNLSRRLCNSTCARRVLAFLICLSLLINIPHLMYKEWNCRPNNYEHSAIYKSKGTFNQTKRILDKQMCVCRISPSLENHKKDFFLLWHNYIFHLLSYTILPAIILIASNAAILKRLHTPRQIVSNQNEHLRSRLTGTLTLVSLIFLSLYFPYAIVQTISTILIRYYPIHCNIRLILTFRILRRLSELLNIGALGINFFLYILGVSHYRSSAIQMLGLHHYEMFSKYLTIEHRNLKSFNETKRNTSLILKDSPNIKLLKVITLPEQCSSLSSSIYIPRLSKDFL